MKTILCIDDKNGLIFANRRQSRDREVINDVLSMCQNSKLWIEPYSFGLFEGKEDCVIVDEDFLDKAGEEDYCFVETKDIVEYEDKIQQLILYHWNRVYPADRYLELDYSEWTLVEVKEMEGYSHEKITKEVYER